MSEIIYLDKNDILLSHKIGMKEFGGELEGVSHTLFAYCLLIANHKTRPSLDEVENWLEKHTVRLDHSWKKT